MLAALPDRDWMQHTSSPLSVLHPPASSLYCPDKRSISLISTPPVDLRFIFCMCLQKTTFNNQCSCVRIVKNRTQQFRNKTLRYTSIYPPSPPISGWTTWLFLFLRLCSLIKILPVAESIKEKSLKRNKQQQNTKKLCLKHIFRFNSKYHKSNKKPWAFSFTRLN